LIEFGTDRIIGIQRAGDCDENLCKVRVDAPVAKFIGVGQRGPFDFAAKAHVIELTAETGWAGSMG